MGCLSGRAAPVPSAPRAIGVAATAASVEEGTAPELVARAEATTTGLPGRLAAASHAAMAMTGEAADVAALARAEATVREQVGPIGILINNGGEIEPVAYPGGADGAAWAEAISSSRSAAYRPLDGWNACPTAKDRLSVVTRSLHLEEGPLGLPVFRFLPGVVDADVRDTFRWPDLHPVCRLPRDVPVSRTEPAGASTADGCLGE